MNGIWVAVKATTSMPGVAPVSDVEVVEVAPGGSHDEDTTRHPGLLSEVDARKPPAPWARSPRACGRAPGRRTAEQDRLTIASSVPQPRDDTPAAMTRGLRILASHIAPIGWCSSLSTASVARPGRPGSMITCGFCTASGGQSAGDQHWATPADPSTRHITGQTPCWMWPRGDRARSSRQIGTRRSAACQLITCGWRTATLQNPR